MNEQLQQAVAVLIQKSISAFEAGAGFMSEQIPDVIHQMLLWHAVYGALMFSIGALIIIAWVVFDVKIGKKAWMAAKPNDYSEGDFVVYYVLLLSVVRLVVVVVSVHFLNLSWLQIWIAPKAWLIEYGMRLVK